MNAEEETKFYAALFSALADYVSRMSPEVVDKKKQVFVGLKEYLQFYPSVIEWLRGKIEQAWHGGASEEEAFARYVKGDLTTIVTSDQLTDDVPVAIRNQLRQLEAAAKDYREIWPLFTRRVEIHIGCEIREVAE